MDDVKTRSGIPASLSQNLEQANLGVTKRRIVERLKRADAKVSDLAPALDMTEAGVRQHLDTLADHGLVVARTGAAEGRGRPPTVWALTDLAQDLFPDRHDDLTVELISAVRTALGDDGLARVIDARAEKQRVAYENAVPKRAALRDRVVALARIRTAEGYVAEVADDPDGRGVLLVEHHCPICTAASSCPGLCGSELALFREVLGTKVTVDRTQHIIAGDRRCTYLIRPRAKQS
ncbi:MAG TPA: metalloregulator ArsR/SmtB family transcription factor [Acidimicrobiia bacterium]|nr:metalloregulator ArsR/SmtB family transcription factor [Acidimicrobiia bacterium]